MGLRKTAITVPEAVLKEVDRAARARGESRSRFITRLLAEAARARTDAAITRKLNELFADEELRRADLEDARDLDRAGTEWKDERW